MGAQRDRRHPEPGRPALGPLPEDAHRGRLELGPAGAQQRAGLGLGEGEIALADVGQIAGEPHAAEPQRRVDPRRGDDPQRGRRMPQEPVEVGDRGAVADLVQVVEDEHDRLVDVLERVDQLGHDEVDALGRVDGERGDGLRRARARERLDHAAPEPPPVAVEPLERQPRERALAAARGDPRAEQRALAGARRGGDQRQRRLQAALERRVQARARDPARRDAGRSELRRGERVGDLGAGQRCWGAG